MSRKRTLVNEQALQALRQHIRIKSGLDCGTFAHVQQLQEDIKKSMNQYLSLQTLNRFFGIIKNEFNPSQTTLDLLAQYLQYSSFSEFEMLNFEAGTDKQSSSFKSQFIISMFAHVDPDDHEQMFLTLLKNIFKIMRDDQQLSEQIYPVMASSSFGRKYFFEQFVNIDSLDRQYGNGLRYYMLHADTKEQRFFAYNIYCYRYFLTGNATLFQKYYAHVDRFSVEDVTAFSPSLIGRYYATQIFNRLMRKDQVVDEPDLTVLMSFSKPYYFAIYLAAEALVLTGEFEKAWELLNNDAVKSVSFFSSDGDELAAHFNILWLMSGFFSNKFNTAKAVQIFSRINKEVLGPLARDYFSFFILILRKSFFRRTVIQKDMESHIQHLVNKTGFRYFLEYERYLHKSDV